MSDPAPLLDRRDARAIKQVARDLAVSVETLPVGSGLLTVAPVSLLLQLRDAFGDEGMADCWAVIDGPALRALKPAAGLRSIDDELAAVRAVAERRQRREAIVAENAANAAAVAVREEPRAPTDFASVADEVRAAKAALGLSSAEFGRLFGVGKSSVSWWLKGRFAPTPDKIDRMRRLVAERGGRAG